MKCPDCGEKMEFNEITQTYNCPSCGKVIQEEKVIGGAISAGKADNVLPRKLTTAIAGVTLVSFIGLAALFTREFGNNNSINNKPNTNGTHTEAESDYNINNDDLSENIVLKEIDEGDVIVTVALPEGYEPIKIDGKYYGEKRTIVTKPAIRKTIYVLTKEESEKYNIIGQKGVSKTNPEDTIDLIARTQYCAESGWTLSGSYQRKTIISQVPATVVKTTKINRTYRKK